VGRYQLRAPALARPRRRTPPGRGRRAAGGWRRRPRRWGRRPPEPTTCQVAGRARPEGGGPEPGVAGELVLQAGDRLLDRRGGHGPPDHHLGRLGQAAGELVGQHGEGLPGLGVLGKGADPGQAGPDTEQRAGRQDQNADGQHQADRGIGHDRAGDPGPQPLGWRGVTGVPPQRRYSELVDPVAQDGEHAPVERAPAHPGDLGDLSGGAPVALVVMGLGRHGCLLRRRSPESLALCKVVLQAVELGRQRADPETGRRRSGRKREETHRRGHQQGGDRDHQHLG
jgi:hypothetical protein